MATVTTPAQNQTSPAAGEQRLVLHGIDWATYRKISDALSNHRVRLTFDRGVLELMTKSQLHERLSRLMVRLMGVLTEEFDLPLVALGEMTCDREDLDRGIEPDECFYITHEPDIRGNEQLDFLTDPPPDLAVEIDISRDSRSRLPIYAALGVPEVWKCEQQKLTYLSLGPQREYQPVAESRYFPGIPVGDILGCLTRRGQCDDNQLLREFRALVRSRIDAGPDR